MAYPPNATPPCPMYAFLLALFLKIMWMLFFFLFFFSTRVCIYYLKCFGSNIWAKVFWTLILFEYVFIYNEMC